MMRWLPLILVAASYLLPIENLVDTFQGELMIRSTWSLLLVVSLYFLINVKRLAVILCCELWSIAYNLIIALGFFVGDVDLGGAYGLTMTGLFVVELIAALPGRTRRDSRDHRDHRNNVHRSSSNPNLLAARAKLPEAI